MTNGDLPAVATHAVTGELQAMPGGASAVRHAMEELKSIRTFVAGELVEGLDFGKIPGAGEKPVLLLPGAQKVALYFNSYPDYRIEPTELGGGHVEYLVTTRLVCRSGGAVVGTGVGSCTTMEGKYRFRGSRTCPACGKDAIIKGKAEYGGGWVCFQKKGGCGAKYRENDPAIAGQVARAVIADKGYDANDNRQAIEALGAEAVIPGKRNRKVKVVYDRHLYRERHVVECYFGKLKQYRRVATRYDKKARNYLGFVWLASINIMPL